MLLFEVGLKCREKIRELAGLNGRGNILGCGAEKKEPKKIGRIGYPKFVGS